MNTNYKFYFLFFSFAMFIVWANFLQPYPAKASMVYVESAQESIREGELFTTDWYVDTEGQNINSIDLRFGYSRDSLELVESDIGNSLISLWIQAPAEVSPGVIRLVGGVPGGVKGSRVPIFHSTFKAIKSGQAKLILMEGSGVLLNDGLGNEDSLGFKPVKFLVMPEVANNIKVFSSTHPNPLSWYAKNNVVVEIEAENKASFSYSFSRNAEESPNLENFTTEKKFEFKNLNDGVYYFKLAERGDEGPWRELPVFMVRVDRTPPEEFTLSVTKDAAMFENKPFLVFSTVDKASGIGGYFIKGAFGRLYAVKSPVKLSRPWFSKFITVVAKDRAGNIQMASLELSPLIPKNAQAGILIMLAIVLIYMYKIIRKNKNGVKH